MFLTAIKTADAILKKNPGHGETEAMKALTMNSQGKQATEGIPSPSYSNNGISSVCNP
jgi:hypothetical protein